MGELGEGWEENREAVTDGVGFYLKYLGSTLLDELPLGESYGEGVSTRAVQRIVDMAKSQNRKLIKVSLKVTPAGIKVVSMEDKDTLIDAQAVTLSVSQAFNLAKDKWEKQKNQNNTQNNKTSKEEQNSRLQAASQFTFAPALPPHTHPRLPKPESAQTFDESETSFKPVSFNLEETDGENLDDCFSLLAEDRSRKTSFPSLATNLSQSDLNDSLQEYMDGGTKCLEAFSRTKSCEDLINI
ncbi:ARH-like protein [Mya arenaria]|uniref:ARH-like protein n=1 Tax=Mya arenaria TaxID=6604 RepID=A0ABY7EF79_MYAAR|nr:ARH-like protein [Mya arenaria]